MPKQKRSRKHRATQANPLTPFFSKKGQSLFAPPQETEPFISAKGKGPSKHSEDLLSPQLKGNLRLESAYDSIQLIRMGSRGQHVVKIQQGLIENGHPLPKFGSDGIFGAETLAALKAYQNANNLVPDGIVGVKTIGTLDRFYLSRLGIPIQPGQPQLPNDILTQTANFGSGLLTLNQPGFVDTVSDPLMMRSKPKVSTPSSANAVGKLGKGTRVNILGRTNNGFFLVNANDMTSGMNKVGFVLGKFISEPIDSKAPTVDRIEAVTTSAKAISGYGPVIGDSDLNSPGPFNVKKTGECKNVHQIHFHLDNGHALHTQPERKVKGFFQHGAIKNPASGSTVGTLGPDGPIELEVRVPNKNQIVIADSPGVWSYKFGTYPFKMELGFELALKSQTGTKIAQAEFDVSIHKNDKDDIPNTKNELKVTSKKDLVRGKSI